MKNSLECLAAVDRLVRPGLVQLPGDLPIRLYSQGRQTVLQSFVRTPPKPRPVPASLARTLWGLEFRSPIFNAAGLFKKGEGYDVVAAQGAGAYLAGTTTATPRIGNKRHGIAQPFAPYPLSGAASNWLGLPNPGHGPVADGLAQLERTDRCPIGVSLSADPGAEAEPALDGLVGGLEAYERAGVDFIEINESCPNTEDGAASLDGFSSRVSALAERFLSRRERALPVLVKLSTDSDPGRLPAIITQLIELGFDGLVLGNTSTDYDNIRREITLPERRLFNRFSKRYGGGVSGRPLRRRALELVKAAAAVVREQKADDFHLVRVGGVESAADVQASLEAGASLVQWYTGYFEQFGRHGHDVYRRLYRRLA